ncbi:MAG: hypothetical protein WKG07_40740 [Hymenobacter sp.]
MQIADYPATDAPRAANDIMIFEFFHFSDFAPRTRALRQFRIVITAWARTVSAYKTVPTPKSIKTTANIFPPRVCSAHVAVTDGRNGFALQDKRCQAKKSLQAGKKLIEPKAIIKKNCRRCINKP